MMPPSFFTMLVGKPPVTFALFGLYFLLIGVWIKHPSDMFLVGILSVVGMRKTFRAFDARRRYKTWEAHELLMLGQAPPDDEKSTKSSFRLGVRLVLAFAAMQVADMFSKHMGGGPWLLLRGVWFCALLLLLWTGGQLLSQLYYRFQQRKAAVPVPPTPEPEAPHIVTWTMDIPDSSPTHATVQSELPDYCMEVLQTQIEIELH